MAETIRRAEIQEHVRRRFLENLERRLRLLRKLYVDRNWIALRSEVHSLAGSAPQFGLGAIADSADRALSFFPPGTLSAARVLPEASRELEALFSTIDTTLVSDKITSI